MRGESIENSNENEVRGLNRKLAINNDNHIFIIKLNISILFTKLAAVRV